jgi:hypothetical protein
MCRIRLWKWMSPTIWEPGGGTVSRELWEIFGGGLQKWSISLCGSSVRGTWRGASLLETLKDVERNALETGTSLNSKLDCVLCDRGRSKMAQLNLLLEYVAVDNVAADVLSEWV